MGLQPSSRLLATRPPDKPPFREPLLRQLKPLAVVGENANRRSPPAAEHKQASREGILLELLLAQPGQRVDALPSIHGLDRHQNAHLRCDLYHLVSQSARL